MTDWLKRYNQGEHAAVWAEMEALGPDIRKSANLAEARKVAAETMRRALDNVESLIEALTSIGYRFAAPGESSTMSWALELRLSNAVAYAQSAGKKYAKDPWPHPALEWVQVEEPPVPAHYLGGRPAWTVHRRPSTGIKTTLDNLEKDLVGPLALSLRAFWETVGSVNLAGSHPLLNPHGDLPCLRVASFGKAEPLTPDSTVGAPFAANLRRAFEWGGFPGWEGHPDPPERELQFLRSKVTAL
jgi:hypothetical protein